MNRFRPGQPSPALIVSVIALITALGGTSYAALILPPNSVGTVQLKNGAVTTPKIKNGAVTAPKINTAGLTVPNALHANSADSVGANGVNTSAIQDAAVTSPKLAQGSVGAAQLKGTYAAVSGGTAAAANTYVNAEADCNPGDRVLGGGYAWLADATSFSTVGSTPDPLTNPNKWIARSKSSAANTLFAWAVCLRS